MLLAIDVGNTHTVLGLFDDKEIVEHWRIATDARRTADEIAIVVQALLGRSVASSRAAQTRPVASSRAAQTRPVASSRAAQTPSVASAAQTQPGTLSVDGLAMCSTVPSVLYEMRQMFRRYYADVPAVIVEPGIRTGVPVLMDNPKEVGADRVLNALAAAHLYGGPAVVVDFGTATTFDAVSAKGEYVGGAIAPGIEISVDALGARGAQLQKVALARPRSVIGKSTVEAMQSGILYGFAGQVDGIVERMAAELSPDPDKVTVVATGGLATIVLDEAASIDVHEPWLTLIGLRLVYERNVNG